MQTKAGKAYRYALIWDLKYVREKHKTTYCYYLCDMRLVPTLIQPEYTILYPTMQCLFTLNRIKNAKQPLSETLNYTCNTASSCDNNAARNTFIIVSQEPISTVWTQALADTPPLIVQATYVVSLVKVDRAGHGGEALVARVGGRLRGGSHTKHKHTLSDTLPLRATLV